MKYVNLDGNLNDVDRKVINLLIEQPQLKSPKLQQTLGMGPLKARDTLNRAKLYIQDLKNGKRPLIF